MSRRQFGTGAEVCGQFGPETLWHQYISALVSGHFGTSAWILRHYNRTPLRQCAGLQYANDLQGHSRTSLLHTGSGSPKVTGNVTIQYSAYDFLYSTLIETINLSRWCGSATGIVLDLQSVGCGFKSYSRQRCITTLGKLFTPMCLCHQAV